MEQLFEAKLSNMFGNFRGVLQDLQMRTERERERMKTRGEQ